MNFIFVVAFKVWITQIKRDLKKDFKVTESTKVCSEHLKPEDFISSSSQKRKLKKGACMSFSVFMVFPNARKVLTFKEIKTSGRARNS